MSRPYFNIASEERENVILLKLSGQVRTRLGHPDLIPGLGVKQLFIEDLANKLVSDVDCLGCDNFVSVWKIFVSGVKNT